MEYAIVQGYFFVICLYVYDYLRTLYDSIIKIRLRTRIIRILIKYNDIEHTERTMHVVLFFFLFLLYTSLRLL